MERNEDTIPLVVQGTTIPMRNWNSRFFDCLKDPCLSIYTAFGCLPCILTQVAGRIRKYPCFGSFKYFSLAMLILGLVFYISSILNNLIENWKVRIHDGETTYEIYSINQTISLFLFSFFCALVWIIRYHVRKKLNIFGDDPTDALYSICCPCCTVVQMARELEVNASHATNLKEPEEYQITVPVESNLAIGLNVTVVNTKEEKIHGADSV